MWVAHVGGRSLDLALTCCLARSVLARSWICSGVAKTGMAGTEMQVDRPGTCLLCPTLVFVLSLSLFFRFTYLNSRVTKGAWASELFYALVQCSNGHEGQRAGASPGSPMWVALKKFSEITWISHFNSFELIEQGKMEEVIFQCRSFVMIVKIKMECPSKKCVKYGSSFLPTSDESLFMRWIHIVMYIRGLLKTYKALRGSFLLFLLFLRSNREQ